MKILSVIVCIVSILITLIAIIICFDGITKGNLASLTSIISLAVQWYCIYCSFTIISLGRLACHDDNETAMVTMFENWQYKTNIFKSLLNLSKKYSKLFFKHLKV